MWRVQKQYIHFYTKLSDKPTAKELRQEGWKIIQNKLKDGTVVDLQICPRCSGKE